MMIDLIRRLIIAGVSLGLIAGNSDHIMEFYDDTLAMTRQIATAGDLRAISTMLDYAYMKTGRFPAEAKFESWMAENFKENSLKDLMTDHWGNRLIYTATVRHKAYVLISTGPDGIPGTADDMKKTGP